MCVCVCVCVCVCLTRCVKQTHIQPQTDLTTGHRTQTFRDIATNTPVA